MTIASSRRLAGAGMVILLAGVGTAVAGDDVDWRGRVDRHSGPSPVTLYDFGGGHKMGRLIMRLDDERFAGTHTGLITSRIDPLSFADGRGRINFFGQFNNAFIGVDNGNPVEDNVDFSTIGSSPNILGAELRYRLSDDFRVGARLSLSVAFNRSDINNDFSDEAGCDEREQDRAVCLYDASLWLRHRSLGTITLGRTETASAGIASISLGGIGYATNSDPTLKGGWHELFGLGRRLGDTAPDTTGVTRGDLVRYDSPTFAGFMVSGSFGNADHSGAHFDSESLWDVALRYAGEFGGFRVAAGVGYQNYDREVEDWSQGNLAVGGSIMHVPTGLYVSGSYTGIGRDAPFSPGAGETDHAFALYGQLGWRQSWFGFGQTVVYGEAGRTESGADAGAYFVEDSATSNFGVGIVQEIDAAAMSLYLSYDAIDAEVAGTEAEDFNVIVGGARVKF